MPATRELVVTAGEAGQRLDAYLRIHLPHTGIRAARRLIQQGRVRLDGRPARKGDRVTAGQRVTLPADATGAPVIPEPDLPLDVLHTTPAMVALGKPAGIHCHPLAPGERGTVANALVARFPECAGASPDPREAGLAHRLDRDTSGLLLAARTAEAHARLRAHFTAGEVTKRYLALVAGEVAAPFVAAAPLERVPGDRRRVRTVPPGVLRGQPAESRVAPLACAGGLTLVSVACRTGRRHQVRAHLAAAGHPIAGDVLYGGPRVGGELFLHADRVILPGEPLPRAPLPDARRLLLARLGFPPGAADEG